MLTIKQIIENKEAIVRGLEKKHFPNAKEAIEAVLAIDNKRKEAQAQLDELLNRIKTLSKVERGGGKDKRRSKLLEIENADA